MSFYTSRSGKPIDGSADNAHASPMKIIPDNTHAIATIKNVELKTFSDGGQCYQITWKLMEGDCKNQQVWQKINPFEADLSKADRALNMMIRLFKLCSFNPGHQNEPTTQDLIPLIGKSLGIVVRQWANNGKEGNYVSEIHPTAGFESKSGELMQAEKTSFDDWRSTKVEDDSLPF